MVERTPNASRVRLARTRRGLTKVLLARRAGISTRSLYDIETGQAEPTPETLDAIAEATRFPIDFFFRHDIEAPEPEAASFRSLRSMPAGKRDAALAAGALAFELSAWIDERFELPRPNMPDLRDYEPEAAAEALRSHWQIGVRPIGNMIHFLESVGVRVFSLAEDRRIDAFSLWHRDVPFVFLNTVKTAEHSRLDAAHELGHLVLHRHGIPWGRNVEKDAQLFGSAFLMPKASMLALNRFTAVSVRGLTAIKRQWGVSAAALAFRLHQLGLVSDWNYRGVCVELSRIGRTIEPDGIARETSQVMSKIFGLGGESKGDAATALALHQADIEALVFGLRIQPPTGDNRRPTARSPRPQLRIV